MYHTIPHPEGCMEQAYFSEAAHFCWILMVFEAGFEAGIKLALDI